MRKILPLIVAVLSFGCAARPAHAQFIGYTSPQTVQQTLANSVLCNGSAQLFVIMNLGQNVHQVYVSPTAGVTTMSVVLQGVDTLGQTADVSNWAFPAGLSGAQLLTATGYYPILKLNVQCNSGGAFTATYSGSSAYSPFGNGAELATAYSKNLASNAPAATSVTTSFTTPAGNTAGLLSFQFIGSGPAGSSLVVTCSQTAMLTSTWTWALNTATTLQTFPVPNSACPNVTVQYVSGGASASTYELSYLLYTPGMQPTNATLGSYTHITGTSATAVKPTTGTLISVNVNTPAAGTISIFDLASASCTGTPATNVVAVITATATAPLGTFLYNLQFVNGICVKASAAMDFTVSAQ